MKYMLLMSRGSAPGVPLMSEWTPEERQAHGAARTSAAPGPGGRGVAKEIQVRPVVVRPG
jgi:hypothetical protein